VFTGTTAVGVGEEELLVEVGEEELLVEVGEEELVFTGV
jgi:hypothetical protein